jgi:small conductance mechanosensitive channel
MDVTALTAVTADINETAGLAWTWSVAFLPKLTAAALLVAIGWLVAKWASRLVKAAFTRTDRLDRTFAPALAAMIRYGVLIVVCVAALGQLGIQTTSIIAALGAAGLAIALALQGTLQNIAAGLMLLWLRPFRVGETIDTGDISGTVREIGLFVTLLDTADGLYRFVPNANLWNRPLLNLTRNRTRRAEIRFTVGHGSNIGSARAVLEKLMADDTRILRAPTPKVIVAELTDAGTLISVQFWSRTGDFGDLQADMLERIRQALDGEGLPAPYRITQSSTDTQD